MSLQQIYQDQKNKSDFFNDVIFVLDSNGIGAVVFAMCQKIVRKLKFVADICPNANLPKKTLFLTLYIF